MNPKIFQNSINNPFKNEPLHVARGPVARCTGAQIPPKCCQGTLRKRPRFEDPQKVGAPEAFLEFCGATWAIWGAVLGPAGRQGAPKSTILASGRIKILKNDIQNEASEKTLVFDRKLFGKSGFLKGLNPPKCFV